MEEKEGTGSWEHEFQAQELACHQIVLRASKGFAAGQSHVQVGRSSWCPWEGLWSQLSGTRTFQGLDSILKSRAITLPTKGPLVKAMVFPVVMYGCESWTRKKAEWRRIDAFELWCCRRLLSPLDCKGIQPVHPKENQSLIFTGRTDAEAEAPIIWPPDAKSWLIGKDPDVGKDWRQEEKGMTEDEMAGWYHHPTWVWVNSRRWWRTGKTGVLQSVGSQRVRHN